MKTTILTPRTVEVSMSLSELLAGLNRHESQMYLCMVVQAMTTKEMGIENTYIQELEGGYQYHHNQFKGITTQMMENFAPILGVGIDDIRGYSSIQTWANGTIYSKGELFPIEKIREIEKDYKDSRAAWVVEAVGYRRVLLEKLIYEKGDREISFVLELDKNSPVCF